MELNKSQKRAMKKLEKAARKYKELIQDELGILTVVCEALWYKSYPGQSMLGHEDIVFFIDESNGLLTLIYNPCPDEEELENIKGESN
jgi:hypothetical protein